MVQCQDDAKELTKTLILCAAQIYTRKFIFYTQDMYTNLNFGTNPLSNKSFIFISVRVDSY